MPLYPPDTVRLLTPDDALAYTHLRREMLADSPWAFTRSPEDDPGCNAQGLAASLARPSGYAIAGAFAHGHGPQQLVAVAGIIRNDSPKTAHRANVWGVYVSPHKRKAGLARAVITTAINTAFDWPAEPFPNRVDTVTLSVSENSPAALALYLSLGFTPWGTQPDAVRINTATYAETHMIYKRP